MHLSWLLLVVAVLLVHSAFGLDGQNGNSNKHKLYKSHRRSHVGEARLATAILNKLALIGQVAVTQKPIGTSISYPDSSDYDSSDYETSEPPTKPNSPEGPTVLGTKTDPELEKPLTQFPTLDNTPISEAPPEPSPPPKDSRRRRPELFDTEDDTEATQQYYVKEDDNYDDYNDDDDDDYDQLATDDDDEEHEEQEEGFDNIAYSDDHELGRSSNRGQSQMSIRRIQQANRRLREQLIDYYRRDIRRSKIAARRRELAMRRINQRLRMRAKRIEAQRRRAKLKRQRNIRRRNNRIRMLNAIRLSRFERRGGNKIIIRRVP